MQRRRVCAAHRRSPGRARGRPGVDRPRRPAGRPPRRSRRRDGDGQRHDRRAAQRGARFDRHGQRVGAASTASTGSTSCRRRPGRRFDLHRVADRQRRADRAGRVARSRGSPRSTSGLLLLPRADVGAGGAGHLAAGHPPADPPAEAAASARSSQYQPGEEASTCRDKLGPSTEIQELRDAFGRAVARVEESEREMTGALEGPAAAGARSPPPGEEQSAGRRLAAQHPRPQRRDARSARGLCRHRPPGRRAVDRPPQPFRGDGGESRDRASPAAVRARGRASRRRARAGAGAGDRPRPRRPSTRPRTSPSRSPS